MKKKYWIILACVVVSIALTVGAVLFLTLRSKKLTINVAQDTNIAFMDEECSVRQLFGVDIDANEKYWVYYSGYNDEIISIDDKGVVTALSTGDTSITMQVVTENKTYHYYLTLCVVDKDYATSIAVQKDKIGFNYLKKAVNPLYITTKSGYQYHYNVEVMSTNPNIVYDATTGILSYIGQRPDTIQSATITCKVMTSDTQYLTTTFEVLVDPYHYADGFVDTGSIFTIYQNQIASKMIKAYNAHSDNLDCDIEYIVTKYPEGAEGYNPISQLQAETFVAGEYCGQYSLVAKVESGLSYDWENGNHTPIYIEKEFQIWVEKTIDASDLTLYIDGVVSAGEWVTMQLISTQKTIHSSKWQWTTQEHMYMQCERGISAKTISMQVMFDEAGSYTIEGIYQDTADLGTSSTIAVSLNVTVLSNDAISTYFITADDNKINAENNTLYLYKVKDSALALREDVYDQVRVELQQNGVNIDQFAVEVVDNSIVTYNVETKTISVVNEGVTTFTIVCGNETATYTIVVEQIKATATRLLDIFVYLYDAGETVVAEYPKTYPLTKSYLPTYAIAQYTYDDSMISWKDGVVTGLKVGHTEIKLCGEVYVTVWVMPYVDEDYKIVATQNNIEITTVEVDGYACVDLAVYHKNNKVEAVMDVVSNGSYAFVKGDKLWIRQHKTGWATITATIGDITTTLTITIIVK